MFTSLIFIGTACIVNMTITINGPKPATGTREGWHILFPAVNHNAFCLFFRPLICSFQLSHFLNICFFVFTFSLGEGPTLLCGQSYPNSKYLFWSFRHVRGQWKNIFHFVFQRKRESSLIWYFPGEFHKVYFWQAFSEDRRLQKQGVIRVKLRKKVGFPAWTRLVKHRLCPQQFNTLPACC